MNILLVDDDPAIRLLATAALEQGGFTVDCAECGQDGLDLARRKDFDLVLLDQLMPDMDGAAVLEQLRANPATRGGPVAFFTAKTTDADVAVMRAQGIAGLIRKPFDPTTLSEDVTSILHGCGKMSKTNPAVSQLGEVFIAEGRAEHAELVAMTGSPPTFDRDRANQIVHRWLGRGGTFGYPEISRAAQRIEPLIDAFPETAVDLQTELETVQEHFVQAPQRLEASSSDDVGQAAPVPDGPVADAVREALDGTRVALVGFDEDDVTRLTAIMDAVGAFCRPLDLCDDGGETTVPERFDLVITRLGLDHERDTERLATHYSKPVLLVGPPASIGVDPHPETRADFCLWPARWEELLMRVYRLLSVSAVAQSVAADADRPILIADDDATITALVEQTLTSYDYNCATVDCGSDALAQATRLQPAAVILDVNMPGMSGFEVLSRLKSAKPTRSIPVVMVTARKLEADVLRGFSLGADDYVSKPFNPIELVARIRRVLSRSPRPRSG